MKKIIAFLFLILFLVGCKAPSEEPTVTKPTTAPTGPTVTEKTIEGGAEVSEPAAPVVSTTGEPVSELKCVGGNIEGVLTNVADRQITLIDDVKVIIHGKFVIHPPLMECDKDTLQPGESTFCAKMQGQFPTADKNRLIFRLTGMESGVLKEVECPE